MAGSGNGKGNGGKTPKDPKDMTMEEQKEFFGLYGPEDDDDTTPDDDGPKSA